jgi:uncharacterized protein (DUF1697 family)
VILLKPTALQDAIDNNPFVTSDGSALHLFFMASPPGVPDLERLLAIKSRTEAFQLDNNIFYLFTPDGVTRSRLAAKVEKCLGVPSTVRNWNTVSKLITMVKKTAH